LGGGNTDLGTPLKAIYPGIVTSVHNHTTGFGKHLHYKISGPWGSVWCHYAHCRLVLVKEGDAITEGQVIAEMGSTGNSTAAHLHFEIKVSPLLGTDAVAKRKEELISWSDPLKFIEKWKNATIDDMPVWVKGYFQERNIDLEKEGDARAKLGEVFQDATKYAEAEKARLKAERNAAEAIGTAAKWEENFVNSQSEIKKLNSEIDNLGQKVVARDKQIGDLETRVRQLEAMTPASGTVIVSKEEYASLKAQALSGVKSTTLLMEIIRRIFGRG